MPEIPFLQQCVVASFLHKTTGDIVHLSTVLILHTEFRFQFRSEAMTNQTRYLYIREKKTKVAYVPNMDAGQIVTLQCAMMCVCDLREELD